MLTFSRKSDTSPESFDGKFSKSPEAQELVASGCGQLNLLPERVGAMPENIPQPLRTSRWLVLGGKALFWRTACSGWLRLRSRSSSGWPWCEWCRTRSRRCLPLPFLPLALRRHRENWPQPSPKCFIFNFCQTTRESQAKHKEPENGVWVLVNVSPNLCQRGAGFCSSLRAELGILRCCSEATAMDA